ncbi:MAG TPA: MurR/RpiR family transcriptional regulator [Solirubrobacterales bacterium]|nr:MurR/RpiR family transcriptional regulator [Solirubrobacterales bacterium]
MSKATGNGSESAERAAAGNGAGAVVRIQSMFDSFTPAERRVAEATLADPEALVLASISEVAERSKGSEAAVSRFARKIGYGSFAEFKLALSRDAASPREAVYGDVELGDDAETVLAKIAADNIRAIEDATHGVDQDALAEASRRISAANRVAFFGFDGSEAIARDALDHFVRVLGNVFHAGDSHDQAVWTALCGPGDVLLLSSHAGTARDLVELAGLASSRGAFVIAITNHGGSRLAELAHLSLFTATREGRFREEALSSRIAALTLIDAIYVLVALQRSEELGERSEAIAAALEGRRVSDKRP